MPAEAKWIIQHDAVDPTSGSLRRDNRWSTLVVPAEAEWTIKRDFAYATGFLQQSGIAV